jgi:hypothetical protein
VTRNPIFPMPPPSPSTSLIVVAPALVALGGRTDFEAQALVAYVLPEGDRNRIGLSFVGATLML